jgi:hypothetical protein
MYKNYKDIPTRKQYQINILETIEYFKTSTDILQDELRIHLLQQLDSIKDHLEDFEKECNIDELNERYDIGAIAIKYLEDGSDAQLRLFDIFWGVLHYSELK